MTHGKTYNKSPRRINHKATKSKTNTEATALERSVEQTTGEVGGGGGGEGLKHFYSCRTQTAALPRPQEVEETDKSKQAQIEQTYEKH